MIFLVWIILGLMVAYWMVIVYAAFRKPTEQEQRLVRALSKDDIDKVIDQYFPAEQRQIVERLIDATEEEATEDIQKMSGMEPLHAPYLSVNIWSMIKKRGGWLSGLFIGETLTATAMGHFEHEIAKAVVLALFILLIISSGGNSGSQAAAFVIRSMALKEFRKRILQHKPSGARLDLA